MKLKDDAILESMPNRILSSLPRDERESMPSLEAVTLRSGMVLNEPDEVINHVYFLNDALVSILSVGADGGSMEIGVVGWEGMVGVPAILGGVTPYRAVVQIGGHAFRMNRRNIAEEFRKSPILRDLLLKYTNTFLVQIAQSSICNCYHSLQERLSRWLLMARDASRSDTLEVTHDLIARMLGTRRASVTVAAGLLQKAALIRIGRGQINILDSKGLESIACECYGIVRDNLHRLA
jgi:CRP-like cAMP-binding protein